MESSFLQSSVAQLREEATRLFERVSKMPEAIPSFMAAFGEWKPPVDLMETESELIAVAEVPGVYPVDLNITLTAETLVLGGIKQAFPGSDKATIFQTERKYGPFERTVALPFPVNPDATTAQFVHGVVTIRMAKQTEPAARKVTIKVSEHHAG